MTNWWNEVFEHEARYLWDEDDWFEDEPIEPQHGKIYSKETAHYDKGCRICGTITGEHGFSFDTKRFT